MGSRRFSFFFAVLPIFCSMWAFSQVSVDPNDRFYREAQGWELKGLTKPLPPIRPYTLDVVREILEDVIESGGERDRAVAEAEFARIFGDGGKSYRISPFLDGSAEFKFGKTEKDGESERDRVKALTAELGFEGDAKLHEWVGLGYRLNFFGETERYGEYAPAYRNRRSESVFDASDIGPFSVYNSWNTNVQFGNSSVYATAGLSRVGFGPFLGDGLALNDTAYHSANLIFSATKGRWSYASVFESIGATANNSEAFSGINSGKYLSFHTLRYRLTDSFTFSYYENILFGPSTNFAYLFPAPFMAVQNIGGASDNVQMGFLLEFRPAAGLGFAADVFVDDVEVNDIAKGDFDTKIRIGAQSGVTYHPADSVVDFLSADYQIVLPYVYSHWEYDGTASGSISGQSVNYQNYTNSGQNIGSSLDPNSDKVSFRIQLNPIERLTLGFNANFIRHANSAEAFSKGDAAEYVLAGKNQYSTDGTASMHQMLSSNEEGKTSGRHVEQAWEKLGFMTSDHKMAAVQAGLSAEYEFPRTGAGQLSLKVGYTFEYIRNANVNTNVYEGKFGIQYKGENEQYELNGETYNSWDELKNSDYVQAEVNRQKQAWIDSLVDEVNHYLSVSFRYSY